MPRDDAWKTEAACAGAPSEWFFPTSTDDSDACYAEGRAICASCPVQTVCLEAALADREQHGLWGGLVPRERRRVARARRTELGRPIPPCGTRSAYGRHLRLGEQPDDLCKTANARKRDVIRRGSAA